MSQSTRVAIVIVCLLLSVATTIAKPQSVIVGTSPLNYIASVGHAFDNLIPNPVAMIQAGASVVPSPQEFGQSIKNIISAGLPIGRPGEIYPGGDIGTPGEIVVPGEIVPGEIVVPGEILPGEIVVPAA